jgi:hypothetical protein
MVVARTESHKIDGHVHAWLWLGCAACGIHGAIYGHAQSIQRSRISATFDQSHKKFDRNNIPQATTED